MPNTNPALQAVPLPKTKRRLAAEPVTYKALFYAIAVAIPAIAGAIVWTLGEAKAAAAAPASDVKKLDQELERHKDESAQVHLQMRDEVYQERLDTRAVYRAIRSGQRQERLERDPPAPLAEPGPP